MIILGLFGLLFLTGRLGAQEEFISYKLDGKAFHLTDVKLGYHPENYLDIEGLKRERVDLGRNSVPHYRDAEAGITFQKYMHELLYGTEYGYGIQFEIYVTAGLHEFYKQYDPTKDRVWICEHNKKMIGFLLLVHRDGNAAQLRYFLIEPEYRGIGLGKKLMELYMEFLYGSHYRSSYLWTTHELTAVASLYKRHGFKLTEEKQSTAFGNPLREQRYDLLITS
jgi:peptidyl-dipeptidase Dcp